MKNYVQLCGKAVIFHLHFWNLSMHHWWAWKIVLQTVYSHMWLFFFTSALLWLCQLSSKQLLVANSYLLWKSGWVKYCKATPNFGLCPVNRTSSLEFEPSALWLIALDRHNPLLFKAKCSLCHKWWRSQCPAHGRFFQPALHSFWVNQCLFVWLMPVKQTSDEFFH